RRRLTGGWTTTFEYTLAKAMDNAPAFGGASLDSRTLAQNWLDLEAEYARSNFDQRRLLTATGDYTRKDWTFASTLSTGSGLPLTPVYFASVGGANIIGSLRPDVTGAHSSGSSGSYANAAAFSVPAPGSWGNAARNSITGPRTFSLNASLARTVRV